MKNKRRKSEELIRLATRKLGPMPRLKEIEKPPDSFEPPVVGCDYLESDVVSIDAEQK